MNVMSNRMKMRFAGFLRGWLQRFDEHDEEVAPPARSIAPAPSTASVGAPPASTTGDALELPLPPILEKLPENLRATLTRPITELGQATISIPVGLVLPQLAAGSVKILFGQLRAAAPGLFRVGPEHDALAVALPLNEVVKRLSSKLLATSPARKTVTVSDEITGPFAKRVRETGFVPPPAPAVARATAPDIATPHPPERVTSTSNHFATATATTPAPETTPTPDGLILAPLAALAEKWPGPMRTELAQLNLPDAQIALPPGLLETALKHGRMILPWRTLRSWIRPTPLATPSARDNFELALPLKIIVPLFLAQYKSAPKSRPVLPLAAIPDLISALPLPSAEPPKPAAELVDSPTSRTDAHVRDEASDTAINHQDAVKHSNPAAPTPRSAPASPPAPARIDAAPTPPVTVVPPALVPSDPPTMVANRIAENGIRPADAPRSEPVELKPVPPSAANLITRRATPREITRRAVALPGVAGAIIALPGGLLVASQVPEDVDADMLAAFLPQIFDRAGESVAKLQMGELDSLSFTAGNVPWMIAPVSVFRDSTIYFAAFGRAGEPLPGAQLAALAAELDHNKSR